MEEKNTKTEVTDRFSRFMFGERNTPINEETTENQLENWDWILGARTSDKAKAGDKSSHHNGINKSIEQFLQNVDYMEVMHHVDTLMTSTKELKPLLNKIKPVLENLISKKS